MRLRALQQQREDAELTARGEPVAALGPSPGFRDLKWLKPVYVGDTITYATEIVAKRASGSRPGWGLISLHNSGINQRGEPVLSFESVVFLQRREEAAQAAS
jgi:acyl dehydratase